MSIGVAESISKWKQKNGTTKGLNTNKIQITLTSREHASVLTSKFKLNFKSKSQFIRWAIHFSLSGLENLKQTILDELCSMKRVVRIEPDNSVVPKPAFLENEIAVEKLIRLITNDREKFEVVKQFVLESEGVSFKSYLNTCVSNYLTELEIIESQKDDLRDTVAELMVKVETLEKQEILLNNQLDSVELENSSIKTSNTDLLKENKIMGSQLKSLREEKQNHLELERKGIRKVLNKLGL